MVFLIVVFIVLGWAGWFWAWGRDRYRSAGLSPLVMGAGGAFATPPPTALSAPRTASAARRRRRQVLAALVVSLAFSLLIARGWAPFWFVTVILAGVSAVYTRAVLQLERPTTADPQVPLRARLGPVVDGENRVVRQPGPVGRPR